MTYPSGLSSDEEWHEYASLKDERCTKAACQEVNDYILRKQCLDNFKTRVSLSAAPEVKKWGRIEIRYLCDSSRYLEKEEIVDVINNTSFLTGTHLSECSRDLLEKITVTDALNILKNSPIGPHLEQFTHITEPLTKAMENRQKYCAINEVKWAPFETMQALFERYRHALKSCSEVCSLYERDIKQFIKREWDQMASEIKRLKNRMYNQLEALEKGRYAPYAGKDSKEHIRIENEYETAKDRYGRLNNQIPKIAEYIIERVNKLVQDYNDSPCTQSIQVKISLYLNGNLGCNGPDCRGIVGNTYLEFQSSEKHLK